MLSRSNYWETENFLMCALFCISGIVLPVSQSVLSVLFFFNTEKGKVPKEVPLTRILCPTFMPTGIFVHSNVTLGYVCYTTGKLLPFCFCENGGTVSSSFCYQLKKWYKCFQIAFLEVPLKWTKYIRPCNLKSNLCQWTGRWPSRSSLLFISVNLSYILLHLAHEKGEY